jgi:hypothetical protein
VLRQCSDFYLLTVRAIQNIFILGENVLRDAPRELAGNNKTEYSNSGTTR